MQAPGTAETPTRTPEDIRLEQQTKFYVVGVIINDVCGPRRWAEWIPAPNARSAEVSACKMVSDLPYSENSDGQFVQHALFVAGVLQLHQDGYLFFCDDYATYADDPNRPEGMAPSRGWTPPPGWEGIV